MRAVARRQVLQLFGGTAIAGAAGGLEVGSAAAGREVGCAIVGAGVAGLYAAWRLVDAAHGRRRPDRQVAVFEASDRVGGRLLSVLLPRMTTLWAEVGGMRYPSDHQLVAALASELLPPDASTFFANDVNFYYLRGRALAAGRQPPNLPYNLSAREKAVLGAGESLLWHAIKALVPAAEADAPELVNQGLAALLLERGSLDAYHLMRDRLGYDAILQNWNAAEAISWLSTDFRDDTVYRQLDRGYQSLPLALAAAIRARGGRIQLGHRLRAVQLAGPRFELIFETPRGERRVRAQSLILALPRRAIELLDGASFFLRDDRFRQMLQTVTPTPLAKLHLAFEKAWWERLGLTAGKSITDLPLRQCYYWGSEADGRGLLLAGYHDGRGLEFWRGLQGGERFGGPAWPALMVDPDGRPVADSVRISLPASKALVEEALRQLGELHGLRRVPAPYAATWHDWGQDPYGGGWHRWNVGHRSAEVRPYMRRPFADLAFHVCGEAWSNRQGWVEGALASAEDVLTTDFGLAPFLSRAPG